MNHADAARQAFVSLLSLSPDYALDPFLVPPPAVAFFDGVKRDNESLLDLIRAQRKALADQERLAEEARKHLFEEQLRRQVEPDRPVLVERVERRTYALNFFPFGIGEFQEDRPLLGRHLRRQPGRWARRPRGFAASPTSPGSLRDYQTASTPRTTSRSPSSSWYAKWIAVGVFGAAYAGGIVDSLLHYAGSVSRIDAAPASTPQPADPPPASAPPAARSQRPLPPRRRADDAPASLCSSPGPRRPAGGPGVRFAF